jgi:hypothetical protein
MMVSRVIFGITSLDNHARVRKSKQPSLVKIQQDGELGGAADGAGALESVG